MGIFFVSSIAPGGVIQQQTVVVGSEITLKCSGVTVIAEVADITLDNLSANIIGFENYLEEELEGKKSGDRINFKEEHIIGCSS